ncbi:hypothetical protein JCGZ_15427 [Jatropha curcas]|uniref:Aminotransferase-like plant mobile domain-containing protein n=1 Tax=Jatropha curcas TaxID=180498 RepID=A0A067K5G4_JATCU|nr:hypothetical protein JCGZ_15427 [Jatropha curcas]
MSQILEIPASAYTLEMETVGALPGIPTFDGEPVPVSRNPLTPGMRPLQLLPVDLGKAHSGGSATDASGFWDLLDPPMRARVVAAGFGDYTAGLRRTQPRFPPAMQYALMERWNDCTHTFVFGFGEMTLTPVDYAAITGLRFIGPVPPLDARYQTTALGAQLVRFLLGLGSGIIIPADLRQAPPPVQLDLEHTTHVSAQRYQEICQRFGFARSYIGRLYSDDLEIGRLRRHQSRQSSAVSQLQAEVERLRTRLEVEGIPIDSSEEDEDGSSSDDAPPSPPPQAAASPSCRQR